MKKQLITLTIFVLLIMERFSQEPENKNITKEQADERVNQDLPKTMKPQESQAKGAMTSMTSMSHGFNWWCWYNCRRAYYNCYYPPWYCLSRYLRCILRC